MDKLKRNLSIKMFTVMRWSIFVIVAVLLFQKTVFGFNFRWTGTDGNWSDRHNWSLRKVPNSFNHFVMIPDGNAEIVAEKFKLESLYVGPGEGGMGDGSLNIINGGELDMKHYVWVNSLSGTSALTVGRDSTLDAGSYTEIAPNGRGRLNVLEGGFYKTGFLFIGDTPTSNGKVTISGQGSRLSARSVNLGAGEVEMIISDGGKLLTGGLSSLSESGRSTVVVSGQKSRLESKEIMWCSNGTAFLNVKDGGYMGTDRLYIDALSDSDQKVTISGEGRVEAQKAIIAFYKKGSLDIETGAFVDIRQFIIGFYYNSS
jgi:T5SS/PEP-CTERM-associated repeat protein